MPDTINPSENISLIEEYTMSDGTYNLGLSCTSQLSSPSHVCVAVPSSHVYKEGVRFYAQPATAILKYEKINPQDSPPSIKGLFGPATAFILRISISSHQNHDQEKVSAHEVKITLEPNLLPLKLSNQELVGTNTQTSGYQSVMNFSNLKTTELYPSSSTLSYPSPSPILSSSSSMPSPVPSLSSPTLSDKLNTTTTSSFFAAWISHGFQVIDKVWDHAVDSAAKTILHGLNMFRAHIRDTISVEKSSDAMQAPPQDHTPLLQQQQQQNFSESNHLHLEPRPYPEPKITEAPKSTESVSSVVCITINAKVENFYPVAFNEEQNIWGMNDLCMRFF